MKEPIILLTSWGGAQYIDWWLLVHLLAGIALGFACRLFGLSLINSFLVVGAILVGWEVYEWLARIPEPWTNTIIDLLLGFMGIWMAHTISLFEKTSQNIALGIFFIVIWAALGIWGWVAWTKRHAKLEVAIAKSQASTQAS